MVEVFWSGEGHPIAISTGWNDEMKKWDVHFLAGNFTTEEEAEVYADGLAGHLQEWPPLRFLKDIRATVAGKGKA